MRCMERPRRHTRRSLASAARITLSIRATLEAKQPTATLPFSVPISLDITSRTPASDPATPSTKTLVLSQTMASTPSSPRRRMAPSSVSFPITGSGSIFQSPVWKTRPNGVRIARPLGSAVEWVMVTSSMSKGPSCTRPPTGTMLIFTSSRMPASRSFSRTRKAVNGVA